MARLKQLRAVARVLLCVTIAPTEMFADDEEEGFLNAFASFVFRTVLLLTLGSVAFIFYLLRTRSPLSEPALAEPEVLKNSTAKNALIADSNQDITLVKDGAVVGQHLLAAATMAPNAGNEEARWSKRLAMKSDESEEEEESDADVFVSRRPLIREVTVKKTVQPAETVMAGYAAQSFSHITENTQSNSAIKSSSFERPTVQDHRRDHQDNATFMHLQTHVYHHDHSGSSSERRSISPNIQTLTPDPRKMAARNVVTSAIDRKRHVETSNDDRFATAIQEIQTATYKLEG